MMKRLPHPKWYMGKTKELIARLTALLTSGRTRGVSEALGSIRPGDAAEVLRELPEHLRDDALLALPPERAADVLEELPDDMAAAAVMDMAPQRASVIVQEMQTDEQADLLADVSEEHAQAILEHVDDEDAALARRLLAYPEDTAGGLMQAEFIAISQGRVAGEVVEQLRAKADEYADYPSSYLYVVDEAGRLDGVVSLRSLLLCRAETPIRDIKNTDVVSVPTSMGGEELVKVFGRYHYLAVPVVDDQGVLVGVVTSDDAMQFAEEDADQEFLRFTGIVGGDELRDMPLRLRSWRRLSWLSVNIMLNVGAASVIALYQDTVRAVVALAVFLPIISDMSGCSGNQAVAISIRELSLGRIRPKDVFWVVWKELSVGLLNGLALGLIIAIVAWLWQGNVVLGIVVGAALWINTIVAVSVGGLLPLALRCIRQDPAIASGPILTTLTDLCGFAVLLTLATRYVQLMTG